MQGNLSLFCTSQIQLLLLRRVYSARGKIAMLKYATFDTQLCEIKVPRTVRRKGKYMWLENLKDLKKTKGMTSKQIAEATNIPESTIKRIFSGETDNPYVDTLRRIVAVLGGSLDDLFAESKIVVANTDLIEMQNKYDKLLEDHSIAQAECIALRDKTAFLEGEVKRLETAIAYCKKVISLQEEIIELHKKTDRN